MEEFRKAPRRLLGALVDHSISRKIKRKTAARNKGDEEWLRHWNTRIPHSCPKIMSREWLLADGIAVDSQPNSKFFHMLPLELRQAIYELALGGATIELEFCDDPKDEHFVVCRKGPRWLFGLPKSCRLTYVEAVNSVYEYNTFRATNILASLFLPSFVAPRLLSKISYLDLHFVIGDLYIPVGSPRLPPDNEATWEEMWGVISAIRGLKMLRVRLSGCGMMHHEVETGLFESMKRCQAVDFTVSVSWAVEGETRNNDWPFSIQREPI